MNGRPFKSDNDEINRLVDWIIRNYATRFDLDERKQKEFKKSKSYPTRDVQERQLQIRKNVDGNIELVTNYDGQLKKITFE